MWKSTYFKGGQKYKPLTKVLGLKPNLFVGCDVLCCANLAHIYKVAQYSYDKFLYYLS